MWTPSYRVSLNTQTLMRLGNCNEASLCATLCLLVCWVIWGHFFLFLDWVYEPSLPPHNVLVEMEGERYKADLGYEPTTALVEFVVEDLFPIFCFCSKILAKLNVLIDIIHR